MTGLSSTRAFGRFVAAASRASVAAIVLTGWLAPSSTESAVANGDTRTVSFSNAHTGETGSFTYMVGGVYDQAALEKLNWFLRDWRLNEPTKMDPHLFDIIWEVYRESGSREPIDVLSGYRSPQTNAMLRRRSRQVAEHSQHMEGRAVDAHFVDVGTARIRDIAMRMQAGGVGFYPSGATPWVHIDSGSVRYWPRMSRDALTRLFPDGKTVFIPRDGQPMPGYEQAKAEIEARGGEIQIANNGGGGFFAWLFGSRGGADDAEEGGGQETVAFAVGRGGGRRSGMLTASAQIEDAGPEAVARAKQSLPTGPTYASATEPAPVPKAASEPAPAPKPRVVASLEAPRVKSDVDTDSANGPANLDSSAAALLSAPLPPRRPVVREVSLANAPLPPIRPADLVAMLPVAMPPARPADLSVGAPAPMATGSVSVQPASFAASNAAAGVKSTPAALHNRLPTVITRGVQVLPPSALALAEAPVPADENAALLKRAAELAAPVPPVPVPNAAAPRAAEGRSIRERAADEVARLFGLLPLGWSQAKSKDASPVAELRGTQF